MCDVTSIVKYKTIEPSYTSKDGCRIVWQGVDEDDTDVVILNKTELENLVELFKKNSVGEVELEDQSSYIRVNSDVTQFNLSNHGLLEVNTNKIQEEVLEFVKVPHKPQYVYIGTKEFYPSVWIRDDDKVQREISSKDPKKSLIQAILSSEPEKIRQDLSPTDLFRVFATRRSTRKFDKSKVEDWKIDKILSAADVAPTAGNFQGFQVFLVKNPKAKEALVEAANKQPYVNAPVVLVFCTDPSRVKLKFPPEILDKFSLQDATIAAAFSLLAASGVGLSTIWIGMFDEEKVKKILGTDLRPSSILCIGYPDKKKPPKSRRHLKELIKVIE